MKLHPRIVLVLATLVAGLALGIRLQSAESRPPIRAAGREIEFPAVVTVNIPRWKSGCVVCLYSCPGSKVGNARYTVRDYEKGTTRFRVRPGVLPEDGGRVGVVLRLR